MFAIKINRTGKYILWCDDNWYETVPYPRYSFTEEEVKQAKKQLKKHYVYYTTVEAENKEEIDKPKEMETKVVKKSIFKLKIGKKAV